MAYVPEADDPFSGGEKVPSLSWRDLPAGSLFTVEILAPAKALQSRDYLSNEPAFWDAEKKRPVMSAVLNVLVKAGPHSIDEKRSIWAQIPSNLFIALKKAQEEAAARFAPGGVLHIKFTGAVPHENPKNNPIKQYLAKYEPPMTTQPDPFTAKPPAPQTHHPAQPTQQAQSPTQPPATKRPAW